MLSGSSFLPSRSQIRSLRTNSKAKVFSIFLAVGLAGVSLALVAYTASSLRWWNAYYDNGNGPLALQFRNYSAPNYAYGDINNATWRNYMDYKDPGVGMTDTYALLAAGVVGTVCAGLILAMPLWLQEQRTFKLALGTQKSETRKVALTRQTLTTLIDTILTLLFLAIAILVWIHLARSHYGSVELHDLPDLPLNYTIRDLADARTTFESWNCGLQGYVADDARRPRAQEVMRQCNNAMLSRRLILGSFALALARLSVWPMSIVMRPLLRPWREFREWRRHTEAMREGKTSEFDDLGRRKKGGKDGDSRSDDCTLEEGRDSVHEVDAEAPPQDFIAELPGCRMSRVEMDEDAAWAEMPGAVGGTEMDAGIAAVEKDAAVKG